MSELTNQPFGTESVEHHVQPGFIVVGIGASAGGVQALMEFFQHVPADSGIAYVVILHLSPDHDSKLTEVLKGVSPIPVQKVTERTEVKKDHVYVVSPNQHLSMNNRFIEVSPNLEIEDRRAPVDIFFRTLAESHGPQAISVILSGTGANGSMGIKRVKECGGAVFVQNPREAEFSEMPRNSIATGMVDDVLSVKDIPARIVLYKRNLGVIKIPLNFVLRPETQQQALREVFTQLSVRTGHDFSNYKRATLLRRVERRIVVHNLPDLPAYAAFLTNTPDEVHALLKDLLISVTNFFRDKEAFDVVEKEVLPDLFEGKTSDDKIRIWVAACATGEEAYSIAMLCAEKLRVIQDPPKVQIFATDIDEVSIANARAGLYSLNDAADVLPERLSSFFVQDGDEYRVSREIREMVLFVTHNFLKDPPFSKLDFVTCRNALIYLNQTAQRSILETFHFALKPKGFLFLGSSESIDGSGNLFSTFSRDKRLFQSRNVATRSYPVPDAMPTLYVDKLKISTELTQQGARDLERMSYGNLHQKLLEEYAAPSLVVNEEYDIVHLSPRAGHYLEIGGGQLSQNLLKLVRPEIRLELRSALYQAKQRKTNIESRGIQLKIEDRTEIINIQVRPVFHSDTISPGYILVIFESLDQTKTDANLVLPSDEPIAQHLEEELMHVKTQLRNSLEQHELRAEELKASNEEFQAMNEELRSAAEELETSKEELQSINEELITVNQELKVKIEETSLTANNLQNLIQSSHIATIFLDRQFRINMFTPAACEVFNLIPTDIGRPVTDITNKLDYAELLDDAQQVLENLQTIEREVQTTEGNTFLMRVLPYRTDEFRINGIIFTFVNVTALKQAEEDLRINHYRLTTALESTNAGWGDLNWITGEAVWNESGKRIIGFENEQEANTVEGWLNRIHPDDREKVKEYAANAASENADFTIEYRVINAAGVVRYMLGAGKMTVQQGQPAGLIGLVFDITERKTLEQQKDEFVGIASHELRTPLTSIKLYAELLLDMFMEANDTEKVALVRRLDVQVDRLIKHVHDLLETTRISEGQLSLQQEQFDLNDLIAERMEDLQLLTPTHRIHLLPGNIQPVTADRERIGQVITNLLSNAIKYTPNGGEISIRSDEVGDAVAVSIRDTGIGISEEMQSKVFDRFFRVVNSRHKKYSGMGLGLYISAGIIHRHGGTIAVESEVGKGSTFRFTLPYA